MSEPEKTKYRKSYGLLVLLMLLFAGLIVLSAVLCKNVITLKQDVILMGNIFSLWVTLLSFVIYKTERIYYYTGFTFEEASEMSSEERKDIGKKFFTYFGVFALLYLIYSGISLIFDFPHTEDIAVSVLGIVITAILTTRIHSGSSDKT